MFAVAVASFSGSMVPAVAAPAPEDTEPYAAIPHGLDGFVAVGASNSTDTNSDFAVGRFGSSASFGNGGRARVGFGANRRDVAYSVAVQADNKVVAAGFTEDLNTTTGDGKGKDFALARFMPDGSLDGSFGSGGVRTHWGSGDTANGVAVQFDGKIVAAGAVRPGTNTDFGVARYNRDGGPDDGGATDITPGDSFGPSSGKTNLDLSGGLTDEARAVIAQPDGRIVLAGRSAGKLALARLQANGTLDTTFGTGGKVITDVTAGTEDRIDAIAVQADGRLVVAGSTLVSGRGRDWVTARYNANGSLDDGGMTDSSPLDRFATNGIIVHSFSASTDEAFTVSVRPDGRIAVGGHGKATVVVPTSTGGTITHNPDSFATLGYLADGTADPNFAPAMTAFACTGEPGSDTQTFCPSQVRGLIVRPDASLTEVGLGWSHTNTHPGIKVGLGLPVAGGPDPVLWTGVTAALTTDPRANPGYIDREEQLGLGPRDSNGVVGDPVNTVTGNMYAAEQDLLIAGRGLSLQMVRFYNSQANTTGPLGHGWTHTYNAQLTEFANGDVRTRDPDGARKLFLRKTDGSYRAPHGVRDTLTRLTSGSFELRKPNGVLWSFTSAGRLTSITDRNNNALSFSYTAGQLTSITDPVGRVVTLTYGTGTGLIESMTDSTNRLVDYDYDAAGDLIKVTDPEGAVTTYSYDAQHNLTGTVKPGTTAKPGATTSFAYDAEDRVISTSADSDVAKLTFAYEPQSSRTLVKDSKNNESVFSYNAQGRITKILDPYAKELTYTWDGAGNKTSATDQNGQTTNYEFDAAGNTTKVIEPLPSALSAQRPMTEFTYGPYGALTYVKGAGGHETWFRYTATGDLDEVEEEADSGPNRITDYATNAYGQPMTVESPRQRATASTTDKTSFAYDPADGTLASVTDAAGKTTQFDYDSAGRLRSRSDALGRTTTYAYDKRDRPVRVTNPVADPNAVPAQTPTTVEFTYDLRGNLTDVKDENGNHTLSSYDRHDRRASDQDATGLRSEYSYDTEGNLASVIEAAQSATPKTKTFSYDKLRRLTSETEDDGAAIAGDVTTAYSYDAAGRMTGVTDAKSRTTNFTYDARGQLTKVTDAKNGVASYERSLTGQLTKTTNPNGAQVDYAYDLAGRPVTKTVKRTAPATDSVWAWTYDLDGNVASRTDARNRTTNYAYDELSRPTLTDYPAGTDTDVSRTYYDDGAPKTITGADGTTTFVYDGRGRMVEEQIPGSRTVKHGYDAVGNRTRLELPGSDVRTFTYDIADRLTGVNAGTKSSSYSYDTLGRLDKLDLPRAGAGTDYSYDTLGRVSEVVNTGDAGATLAKQTYAYDKVSNVERITDAAGRASDFAYDDLDRLLSETHAVTGGGQTSRAYTYDAGGNRSSLAVDGAAAKSYTYNDAEQLTAFDGKTSSYDANGALTSETTGSDTTAYSYDMEGRATGVDVPGAAADESYGLDALGRRISETRGLATTSFVLDGDNIAQSTTGSTTTSVVRGLGLLSTTDGAAANDRYFGLDAQGSVAALSDNNGGGTDSYSYGAFGEMRSEQGVSPNPFRYLGETYNPALKTSNFHARTYSSGDGRFLSRDPVDGIGGLGQTLNPYAYGANSPFLNPDPSGLCFLVGNGCVVSETTAAVLSAPFRAVGFSQEQVAGGYLTVGRNLPVSAEVIYGLEASKTKAGVSLKYLALMGVLDVGTGGRGGAVLRLGEKVGGDKFLTGYFKLRKAGKAEDGENPDTDRPGWKASRKHQIGSETRGRAARPGPRGSAEAHEELRKR